MTSTRNFLWSLSKKCATAGLIGVTISDRYASFMAVRGSSMSPTLNPREKNSVLIVLDDYVLVEKLCLDKYKFSRGDIVVFRSLPVNGQAGLKRLDFGISHKFRRLHVASLTVAKSQEYLDACLMKEIDKSSPSNYNEKNVKRIAALPGDWINLPSLDTIRVPEGHCWVVGDNAASSRDSRSFGPIPLGLICGRITHVVWPPQRIGRVGGNVVLSPEVEIHASEIS